MNAEERQKYNKEYYKKNKDDIIRKACIKVYCEFCEREINYNYICKHQATQLCKRFQDKKINRLKRMKDIDKQLNDDVEINS